MFGWSFGNENVIAAAIWTFKNDYDGFAASLRFSATAFRLARIDRYAAKSKKKRVAIFKPIYREYNRVRLIKKSPCLQGKSLPGIKATVLREVTLRITEPRTTELRN